MRVMLLVAMGALATANYFSEAICPACTLDTPLPDAATQKTLEETYKRRFLQTASHVGDTLSICNTSWCAKYTLLAGDVWGDGQATRRESHPSNRGQGKPES